MALDFFSKLRRNTEDFADRIAFKIIGQHGQEVFTYKRIAEEVSAISHWLQESGVGKGTTVGILMENHPRWGIAFLAAQSVGARIVPFDILHDSETLARLLLHSECRFVFGSAKLLEKLEEVQSLLPERLPGLVWGTEHESYASWEDAQAMHSSDKIEFPLVEGDLDETFLIVYTSGTTGNPKGVMLTQRNLYLTVEAAFEAIDLYPEDNILGVLPLYHMLALMANFLIPLYLGARVTYLDVLEPQRIVQTFREEGITVFICVPQFFYLLHRRIMQEVGAQPWPVRKLFGLLVGISGICNKVFNVNPGRFFFPKVHRMFGKLRLFAVGGARFDIEIATSFRNLGFRVLQAYGMTETSAAATTAHPAARGATGTVGLPFRHVELRIDEPDEQGIGEVLMKGANIMQGYWKNPEATAETLRDGWLHSGDLGFIDQHGFLHITGRKKDVIVLSSGKNIFPEEIEQAYEKRCPFIKEMCVVGIEDSKSSEDQERLHALIVPDFDQLRKQGVVNAADMIRYMMETISQQLPSYKRVRTFDLTQEPLPRTTTRKIKRFEVQRMVEQRSAEGSAPRFEESVEPRSPAEAKIFDLLLKTGKTKVARPEMNLELDCGFDSLERVEFLSNVSEQLKVHFSDEAATEIFTVGDLVLAVEKRLAGEVKDSEAPDQISWSEILQAPLKESELRDIDKILKRRPVTEVVYFLLTRVIWLLCKVFFRIRIVGQENLPRDYPFMICPNHLSFLDGFVFSAALPFRVIRRLFFLGYSDYFGTPTMSYLGSLIKVVPVDADRKLRHALRLGAHGMEEKLVLCVFPEGERSIDGQLKTFRQGPAILATHMGVPVVPVSIRGTFEAWSRGSSKIRLFPITIRLGEPLTPRSGESPTDFNRRLFQAVAELFNLGR